jgi:hypothetical protein
MLRNRDKSCGCKGEVSPVNRFALAFSSVQIRPLQSIVLSGERVSGTLQPSEFLGEFVQADGWAPLPVTPLNLVQVSVGELF